MSVMLLFSFPDLNPLDLTSLESITSPALQKTFVGFSSNLPWDLTLNANWEFWWSWSGLRLPRDIAREVLKISGKIQSKIRTFGPKI